MKLSEHFTLEEFTFSQTAVRFGIDNTPSQAVIKNMTNLCEYILEPIRRRIDKPLFISSGYRSPALNRAIKGAKNSQHITGHAADISVSGMSTEELYQWVKKSHLYYDQIINEFNSWVHVSFSSIARLEAMRATKVNGRTIYTPDK